MQYSTKKRTLFKTISWRTIATLTTAVLVYIFTGEIAIAITIGGIEVIAKMIFYFAHERVWAKIKYGKKEIPSFVVWITGLPSSGKREIADGLYKRLLERKLKVGRIDSRGVRPLFPETGFAPGDVDQHVRRAGHLCSMLEKNGVIVVASFVSPYKESRSFARKQANHFVEVYLNTTAEACEKRDDRGRYGRAKKGEYRFFPGVNIEYEIPNSPEIIIDVDSISIDEATSQIESYLQRTFINHH